MSGAWHNLHQWIRATGVRRFHTVPCAGEPQTVGQHSCGVALIVLACHPLPSAQLLQACLTHDLNESVLGDLPAPTKWRSAVLNKEWEKLEEAADSELGLP